MQLRGNFVRISTRPLLLIVALFCALAIGLTGVYTLRSQSLPTNPGVTQPFAFDHETDNTQSRNRTAPVPTQDPWANVGK